MSSTRRAAVPGAKVTTGPRGATEIVATMKVTSRQELNPGKLLYQYRRGRL